MVTACCSTGPLSTARLGPPNKPLNTLSFVAAGLQVGTTSLVGLYFGCILTSISNGFFVNFANMVLFFSTSKSVFFSFGPSPETLKVALGHGESVCPKLMVTGLILQLDLAVFLVELPSCSMRNAEINFLLRPLSTKRRDVAGVLEQEDVENDARHPAVAIAERVYVHELVVVLRQRE